MSKQESVQKTQNQLTLHKVPICTSQERFAKSIRTRKKTFFIKIAKLLFLAL